MLALGVSSPVCFGALACVADTPPQPICGLRFSLWLCVHQRSDVSPVHVCFLPASVTCPQTVQKTGSPVSERAAQ